MKNKAGKNGFVDALRALFSSALILGPTVFFALRDDAVVTGIVLVAGAIAAAFLNLKMFQSIKGAGFEAQLRDTIDEAQVTIETLKKLYRPFLLTSIHQLAYGGRTCGFQMDIAELLETFERTAADLGLEDDVEIKHEISGGWRWYIWDALGDALRNIEKEDVDTTGYESRQKHNEFLSELMVLRRYRTTDFPDAAEIQGVLDKHGVAIGERSQKLLDTYYSHVADYSEHITIPEEKYLAET